MFFNNFNVLILKIKEYFNIFFNKKTFKTKHVHKKKSNKGFSSPYFKQNISCLFSINHFHPTTLTKCNNKNTANILEIHN